jgi:hypothetical protein
MTKYAYVVLSKDGKNGDITIDGVFSNQSKAWDLRDDIQDKNEGRWATAEKVPLNEPCDILLNMWSFRPKV